MAVASASALIVLGLAVPASAAGSTWYVDGPNGVDGVDCGLAPGVDACATILDAVTKADDGDTIAIAAGSYTAALQITKSITLTGASQSAVILQDAELTIGDSSPITVAVSNMTIEAGPNAATTVQTDSGSDVTLSDVTIAPPAGEGPGPTAGVIAQGGSTLTVTDSTISGFPAFGALGVSGATATVNNSTISDSGIGAIVIAGDLTFTGGSVADNRFAGVLVASADSVVDFTGTSITGNGSPEAGTFSGGILLQSSGSVTASGVTISDNFAGVMLGGGSISISDSVVSNNGDSSQEATTANGLGIGLLGEVNQGPGSTTPQATILRTEISNNTFGLLVSNGQARVNESTVVGNATAGLASGGSESSAVATQLLVMGSTIADNGQSDPGVPVQTGGLMIQPGSELLLGGSIVEGAAGAVPACSFPSGATGALLDGGFNIASDASCGLTLDTSLSDTDALLGPLGDNGGVGQTMLPDAESPAVDAIPVGAMLQVPSGFDVVDAALCAPGSTDQRGLIRPQGVGCEVGAAETLPVVVPDPVVISPDSLPGGTVDEPYEVTLAATGGDGGPYTWAIASGTLPDGLMLDPETGEISGTPTTDGLSTFAVSVVGQDATKEYSVTIAPAAVIPPTDPPTTPTDPPTTPINPTPPSGGGSGLADTGFDAQPGLVAGIGFMMLLGVGLMLLARRRRGGNAPTL